MSLRARRARDLGGRTRGARGPVLPRVRAAAAIRELESCKRPRGRGARRREGRGRKPGGREGGRERRNREGDGEKNRKTEGGKGSGGRG